MFWRSTLNTEVIWKSWRFLPWCGFWDCSRSGRRRSRCACGNSGLLSQEWGWTRAAWAAERRVRCGGPKSTRQKTRSNEARTETFQWRLNPAAPRRTGWCSRSGVWSSCEGWEPDHGNCISLTHTSWAQSAETHTHTHTRTERERERIGLGVKMWLTYSLFPFLYSLLPDSDSIHSIPFFLFHP